MSSLTTMTPDLVSSAVPNDLRRHGSIGLFAIGLLSVVASAVNILTHASHTDGSVYGFAAITLLAAATSQWIVRPRVGRGSLRVRWGLWASFLLLNGVVMALGFVNWQLRVPISPIVTHVFFSIGYSLAYVVTINPPRSTVWRRLWLVDAAIAAVMGTIFFLVFRHGETAGPYSNLLFTIALQCLFTLGSFLSLRAASSVEDRDLARCMTLFFFVEIFVDSMTNLPAAYPSLPTLKISDIVYPMAALAVLALPLARKFFPTRPLRSQPLPPAATILITSAVLLACLPLLRWTIVFSMALIITAVALFAVRLALLQSDFDYERTSLLQSNKQLRELAYTDTVTGVANRRRFVESARNALLIARCGFGPASIILFRLDDLQRITDTVGRRASELHLRNFSASVQRALKPIPTHFGRIASDEFVLLLEETPRDGALRTIESLRSALDDASVPFSAGTVAATSSGPDSVERWLADADTDLRRSKREVAVEV